VHVAHAQVGAHHATPRPDRPPRHTASCCCGRGQRRCGPGGAVSVERGGAVSVERGGAVSVERGGALSVERGGALSVERGGALSVERVAVAE
jgi:hypothetical protein